MLAHENLKTARKLGKIQKNEPSANKGEKVKLAGVKARLKHSKIKVSLYLARAIK